MKAQFKLIIRNQLKKPVISFVNLMGLSISLALVITLSVYCYGEFTVDSQHKKADNIYLFVKAGKATYTPGVLKDAIDNNVSGIEKAVRITNTWNTPVFQYDTNEPINSDLVFADKGFFDVFTYECTEGNLKTALNNPMDIVISSTLAHKLFGNSKALGKSIKLDNKHWLTVAGVFKIPQKSSIEFNAITNMQSRQNIQPSKGVFTSWEWNNFHLILLLNQNTSPQLVASNIINVVPEGTKKRYDGSVLLPLKEIYFSGFADEWSHYLKGGNKKKTLLLTFVALLVLVIALLNYINVSISQKHERVKQTSLLRINGANYQSIFSSIFAETLLFYFTAITIAHLIIFICEIPLKQFSGIDFDLQFIFSTKYLLTIVLVGFILCVISSTVPSFQLLTNKLNLSGRSQITGESVFLRGSLVVFQMVIAMVLIAFTILIQKQVSFGSDEFRNNQDNIVGIQLTPQLIEKQDVLKDKLAQIPNLSKITFTQYFPGKEFSSWCSDLQNENEDLKVCFNTFSSNSGLFSLMNLDLEEGSWFNENNLADKGKVLVNESFVKKYNLRHPIGTVINMHGGYEIAGVIKDFYYYPINQPIEPLVIRNEDYASVCLVKVKNNNFKELNTTIASLKKIAKEISPDFPVEVSFFDKAIENMYQSEIYFQRTFSLFSICAIVICCLGILALSLSSCHKRTKEIGIRKVNGAKISEILTLLNKDFIKWVAIAFVIATPIAWFAMNKWLENFAYKTNLSWWIFALAGLLALAIALLTVSYQSWKAAVKNPVEALRYE